MLDEIFNEYKSTSTPIKSKVKDQDSFLNEDYVLSMKSKKDDVMSKYCTLYNKDSIKPLNMNYLEKKKRREDSQNSAGPQWYNMTAPELTPDLRDDLKAMQLKQYIDPTNFHKKNDTKGLPKFFHIGTIQDNIVDGKKNRLKKSEVHNRIIEELIDLDKNKNFSIRKFDEYQQQRRKIGLKKTLLNKYKLKSKGKNKGVITK